MTREIASRIASNIVKEFRAEKHFALSLPEREDLELMAQAFANDWGCRVVWNSDANKIAVRCPEELCEAV